MNKPCQTLKDIVDAIKRGEDVELVIPYDLTGFDEECRREIFALYLKYGKNEMRLKACKEGMKALC